MMKRNILILIGIVILGLIVFAPESGSRATAEKSTVRVTYVPDYKAHKLLLDVGEKEGIFEKNGVVVDRKPVEKGVVEVLTSGNTDIIMNALTTSTEAYLNDVDQLLLANLNKYPLDYYAASKYKKEDFENVKKVGVTRIGSTSQAKLRFFPGKIYLSGR